MAMDSMKKMTRILSLSCSQPVVPSRRKTAGNMVVLDRDDVYIFPPFKGRGDARCVGDSDHR
jgi:hypothetical protein